MGVPDGWSSGPLTRQWSDRIRLTGRLIRPTASDVRARPNDDRSSGRRQKHVVAREARQSSMIATVAETVPSIAASRSAASPSR